MFRSGGYVKRREKFVEEIKGMGREFCFVGERDCRCFCFFKYGFYFVEFLSIDRLV